ncbi:tripartite tricarboxylate transporter TctB family protein [Paenibacillus sp. IB182496]|uniref:Tripartite tricarboxylate transporter TctB family protein n=1 Tax=Paenibacillus sabuli TaxID=2772509 RepID=A0A927BVU6_9BACL|nr:tripartite tricarboxylate transporter TctB family protein [Paenibacillus sabuli]MBD2846580.1 tripartite tricarboxylate transporter TctB family protein [Paenibacillus sabuli]
MTDIPSRPIEQLPAGELEQEPQRSPAQAPGEYLLVGLLLLIVGALFLEALKLPGIYQGYANDAGTLPQAVTSLLLLLLGMQAIGLIRRRAALGSLKEAAGYLFSKDILVLILGVTSYAVLVELLHFEITTFLFLWGCMMFLDWRRPWLKLLVSLGSVIGLILVFYTLFHVVLP